MTTVSSLVRIFGYVTIAGAVIVGLAGVTTGTLSAAVLWSLAASALLSGLLLLATSEALDNLHRLVRWAEEGASMHVPSSSVPRALAPPPISLPLTCPSCQTQNPEGVQFCRACGVEIGEALSI